MIIFYSIEQLKNYLDNVKKQQKIVGFVPTMGALHQGHISLIETARAECDLVVCSIFVNPTQFNDLNDLKNYPRTFEADCHLLEKAQCDVVFMPEISEIYTPGELDLKKQNIKDKTWTKGAIVDFDVLAEVMEGAHRPGHFNGVAQVVSKLFRIVEPHKAYFGQKDFQQLAIIRSMVQQLAMPIGIITCPIVREANGLAMSSRNERLTARERDNASVIAKTLFKVKELHLTLAVAELKALVDEQLKMEPQIQLEYFEIADASTLQPVIDFNQTQSAVACIAVKLGNVRLIDNVVLF